MERDKKLVRFYLPLRPDNLDEPVWSVIRKLSEKIGEQLTTYLRDIADENPLLKGIIDRVDFNATTHGVRDLADDRLSNLIERISEKRLGLADVEPDIIGRSYEYLIRKFAEGSVSSAGEFYTPKEVGLVMARITGPEPGMEIYDPCCGSAGLLIKCQLILEEKMSLRSRKNYAPFKLYRQEYIPETWAMANMNMIIHDMEGARSTSAIPSRTPSSARASDSKHSTGWSPIRCGIRTGGQKSITTPMSWIGFPRARATQEARQTGGGYRSFWQA